MASDKYRSTTYRQFNPDNLDKHITLTSSQQMQEICKPLFDCYPVSFFDHSRNYYDSSHTYLSTNPEVTEIMFKEGHYRDVLCFMHPEKYEHEYVIWDILDTSQYAWNRFSTILKEKFNLTHFLNLTIKNKHYTELFCFAGNQEESNLNNIYFTQENVFRHFAMYFRDKAEFLLREAEKERMYFPYATHETEIYNRENTIIDFFARTKLKKVALIGEFSGVSLTNREIECVQPLLSGCSYKEIARKLNISNRTVEDRIENLRNKFKCERKQDLLAILAHDDIKKILYYLE